MLINVLIFLMGTACGAFGMYLVVRNNQKKFERKYNADDALKAELAKVKNNGQAIVLQVQAILDASKKDITQ